MDVVGGSVRFAVSATACSAVCTACGQSSTRIHSRYPRRLADHAVAGHEVTLLLQTRRFRCVNPQCYRVIFAEQIPGLAERYQRRSSLLKVMLTKVALALGGRAGQRMTGHLAAEVSRSALLRLVRSLPLPTPGPLRAVGVDDFAIRRGHVYGTVVINMADHRPVDLLGDRTADTLAAWLAEHHGIRVVCRDRGGPYAEGARVGAPDAIQIADRWHLLYNLTGAVDRVVRSHRKCLHKTDDIDIAVPRSRPKDVAKPGLRETNTRERLSEIHALLEQGASISEICRRLNLARNTVRRYARAAIPEQMLTVVGKRGSELDAHLDYLAKRWTEGCFNATELHQEIRERGYRGSPNTVRAFVADWRITSPPPDPNAKMPPKPRHVTGWIMRPAGKLSDDETTELHRILGRCDTLTKANQLVGGFGGMIRERRGRHLDTWITDAKSSGIAPLARFADGLIKDYDAVRNGLTLELSSGTVEGHVNRIKMIKRTMYGRANFDLLRRRVLLAD